MEADKKSPTQGEGENEEFTEAAVKAYLDDSSKCPYCGSTGIEAAFRQNFDGSEFENKVGCKTCNREWWEIYRLRTIEISRS
jgi:formate dehydrogenase maturation protein FdhE